MLAVLHSVCKEGQITRTDDLLVRKGRGLPGSRMVAGGLVFLHSCDWLRFSKSKLGVGCKHPESWLIRKKNITFEI